MIDTVRDTKIRRFDFKSRERLFLHKPTWCDVRRKIGYWRRSQFCSGLAVRAVRYEPVSGFGNSLLYGNLQGIFEGFGLMRQFLSPFSE